MSDLYSLRNRIRYMLPCWVTEIYDDIRHWFNPRQKWLTKQIPNHWVDKDWLWELCILEGIKHYVESDNGLGFNEWDFERNQSDPEYPEDQKIFDREVQWAYDEITIRLPHLEVKKEKEWQKIPKFENNSFSINLDDYEKVYGMYDELEKEIKDRKTEIMIWAIKNRERMWT